MLCLKIVRQTGFTLVEALITLLITAFGMLALAGFQVTLSRNSDVAKQRSEATRLAQEKMEQLRAFDTLTTYSTTMIGSTTATQETINTNSTFTRTWLVSASAATDTGRSVVVTVSWTDRAGDSQQVQLLSQISATGPVINGALWFPLPDGTILRRPKNRSIDIPIPAVSIDGTQKSAVRWSGASGGYLVFSNLSGDVVQKCSTASAPTASDLAGASCAIFNGYLLTGYISGDTGLLNKVTGASLSNTQYIAAIPATECSVQQATDQNDASVILTGYKSYACLITPTDHDSDASTARVWSGQLNLTDVIGTFSTGNTVCRYTTGSTDNNDHPAQYTLVDRSLDNQNFFLASALPCVSGSVALYTKPPPP